MIRFASAFITGVVVRLDLLPIAVYQEVHRLVFVPVDDRPQFIIGMNGLAIAADKNIANFEACLGRGAPSDTEETNTRLASGTPTRLKIRL